MVKSWVISRRYAPSRMRGIFDYVKQQEWDVNDINEQYWRIYFTTQKADLSEVGRETSYRNQVGLFTSSLRDIRRILPSPLVPRRSSPKVTAVQIGKCSTLAIPKRFRLAMHNQ